MASWITHMIIADKILEEYPCLDKRGFCVGNIGPDCNEWNEDGTELIPPKQVTHWMTAKRKKISDTDGFYQEYFVKHCNDYDSKEFYSYLLGYYSHLITDAYFQWYIREEKRVKDAWNRIRVDERYKDKIIGMEENWDNFKLVVTSREIKREHFALEAEYLNNHPDYECSYFTQILTLKEFPDYIDYLPKGSTVRKIRMMTYMPPFDKQLNPVSLSRDEYNYILVHFTKVIIETFQKYHLFEDKRLAG